MAIDDQIDVYGDGTDDPSNSSMPLDENGDPVGGLDQANMYGGPPSPGGLSAAQKILADAPRTQEGFVKEYQGVQQQQQARADAARETLRKAREAISQKKYNERAMWFNLAAALQTPTRTGGFGESLGYGARVMGEDSANREKWGDDRENKLAGYDQALAGYGTGEHAVSDNMLSSQLSMLQLRQRLQAATEQRALGVVGRAGSTTGQLPLQKALEAQGILPGSPEYIKAMRQYSSKLTHLPADPNAPVNLTEDDKKTATEVGHYHMDPAKAFARIPGEKRQALQAYIWNSVNPDYSDYRYGVTKQAVMQYGSTKDTDPGGRIVRFNTAVSHLGVVRDLAKALNNGDIGLINEAKQRFAKATGKPAPTNLQGAVEIVMPELASALVAGGGTGGERAELKELPSLARSPSQFAELIDKTWIPLMGGKLDALRDGFYSSVEHDAGMQGWFERKLSKNTRKVMREHGFELHDVGDEDVPDTIPGADGAPTALSPEVKKRVSSYLERAKAGEQ